MRDVPHALPQLLLHVVAIQALLTGPVGHRHVHLGGGVEPHAPLRVLLLTVQVLDPAALFVGRLLKGDQVFG
ncbi:hypothetical protein STTU_5017 [Streptomyces sp. Tu6071]|nr:hypothetical protein STTU_5017 [Streptomyces sp. Tu6071]